MAERTLPLPPPFIKWLLDPAFIGALMTFFAAAAASIRRRTRQPTVPRMSESWLRAHDAESGHQSEFWRDRW